ncbi:MAG: hypothetical protein H0T84_02665, partial [Tatlockia sp.]|nr:hypothetical protein [Tatlockia sp.]
MMIKYTAHNSLLPFYLAHQLQVDTNKNYNQYNLCFSYALESENHATLLIAKLQELVQSKPYLRQTFALVRDKVVARIHNELTAVINHVTSSPDELEKLEKTLINQQHDLRNESAVRLTIIKISESNTYIAFFNIHHILMDGTSLDQFINDLNWLMNGHTVDHESVESYLECIEDEPPLRDKKDLPELAEYLDKVHDIANSMEFFSNNTSNAEVLYFTQELPTAIMLKLVTASKKNDLSLFNLLLITWSVYIIKLSNTTSTLINYPVNIRHDKFIPGCFINTLVFPLSLNSGDSYSTIIKEFCKASSFYKRLSKVELSSCFDLGPLSSFASSNFAKPANLVIRDKTIVSKGYPQIAHSNLSIKYKQVDDALWFSMDCLAEIMPDYLVSTLLSRFFNFLDKLLDNPKQELSQVDLTFCREKMLILAEFNKTAQ